MSATTARDAALTALVAVERGGHGDEALDRVLLAANLARRDRSLATELVYGTLRRRNSVDHALGLMLRRPLADLTPWIRNVLRLGAYQLLYLDRVPAHAAVDQSVRLARRYGHRGTASLANAVLRRLADKPGLDPLPSDPLAALAVKWSHPEWLVARWLDRYGLDAFERLCRWNNEPPPVVLRPNRLRGGMPALIEALEADGVNWRPGELFPYPDGGVALVGQSAVTDLLAFRSGLCQVQDEGAMLVSLAAEPQPGMVILDACAAPGGKATHLAELMDDRGTVLAVDVNEGRLGRVREACDRLGVISVRTVALDARDAGQRWPDGVDAAVVDAPCTGTGVLRRNPEARWRRVPEDITRLAGQAGDILCSVAQCVRTGGTLVYATCSLEPEENEQVVSRFLGGDDRFRMADLSSVLPPRLAETASKKTGMVQLFGPDHGADGLFVARMTRIR